MENLLPWEPTILSRMSRNYFCQTLVADPGDACNNCDKPVEGLIVCDNAGSIFCSWECLIKRAKQFPMMYDIIDTGAY